MIVLNIKKEDIKFTKHKNGNHYATIVVEKRKELDKYENTHTVYNGQTATERAEKAKKELDATIIAKASSCPGSQSNRTFTLPVTKRSPLIS